MAKNLKKNKRFTKTYLSYLILILLVILAIFLMINLINNFNILEKKEIFASFIVSEHIGFDLNDSALTFGLVQPGQSSSREISVENNHEIPVLVNIISKGDISDFLIVSENDFILKPNEKKEISFSVFPLKDIEFKEYKGVVEIILKKI